MFFKTSRLGAFVLALGMANPPQVEAQEAAFAAAIKDLASTPGPAAKAKARMQAALAEWDRQIQALEASAAPSGEPFERHLALGLAYRRRGRQADALGQFDTAATLRPGSSDVHVLRGLTLEASGRMAEAGQAFHAAWTSDSGNPVKASLVLSRTADLNAADRGKALDALRQALGRILSGNSNPAETSFLTLDPVPDTLSRTPIVGSGAVARVFAHLAAGRLDEAVAAFGEESASAVDASTFERGRIAETEGRFADAAREYTSALAATLAGRHALYVGIGRLAQVQGQTDAAVDAFTQAVRLSPNDPLLRRELAAALVAAGRTDEAFAELVAALLIAPDNAEALAALADLYVDSDRPHEAIPVLRRVLTIRPTRYQTHYTLAVALSRAGHAEEAAREFERFERLSREALDARRRSVVGEPAPPEPPRGNR